MNEINKTGSDTIHSYNVKIIKKKLPTTFQMVDNTLIKLYNPKGVSLQHIYKHIIGEYVIYKTAQRYGLIKKRLIELKRMGYITNVTGKGLVGRLKLLNKNEFEKKFISKKEPQIQMKPNLNRNKLNIRSNDLENTPIQDTNVDNLNSLSFSNGVNNSTPLMEVVQAPAAPLATKKARKRNYDVALFETPRSSKGKRRRKIGKS